MPACRSPAYASAQQVVFFDNGKLVWEAGGNRSIDVSRLLMPPASEQGVDASQPPQLYTASDGYFTMYWGAPGTTPLVVIPRAAPELDVVEGVVVPSEEEPGAAAEPQAAAHQTVVMQDDEEQEEQQVGEGGEGGGGSLG